jgi:hypothetical protein
MLEVKSGIAGEGKVRSFGSTTKPIEMWRSFSLAKAVLWVYIN